MSSGDGIMEIGEGNWFMVGCRMSIPSINLQDG